MMGTACPLPPSTDTQAQSTDEPDSASERNDFLNGHQPGPASQVAIWRRAGTVDGPHMPQLGACQSRATM